MNKIIATVLFLYFTSFVHGQVIGRVDKKTKEFTVAPNPKGEYRVFGYQYANLTTKKMICFSSRVADVKDNFNGCPLGSYFDTGQMKEGDRILFLGYRGPFAMMTFIGAADKKKTIFYLPKNSFVVK